MGEEKSGDEEVLSHAPLISADQLLPSQCLWSWEFFVFVLLGFFFFFSLLNLRCGWCLDYVDPCSLFGSTAWFSSLRFHSTIELSSSQIWEPENGEVDPKGQGLSRHCSCPQALCLRKEWKDKLNFCYLVKITPHMCSVLVNFLPAFHKHFIQLGEWHFEDLCKLTKVIL